MFRFAVDLHLTKLEFSGSSSRISIIHATHMHFCVGRWLILISMGEGNDKVNCIWVSGVCECKEAQTIASEYTIVKCPNHHNNPAALITRKLLNCNVGEMYRKTLTEKRMTRDKFIPEQHRRYWNIHWNSHSHFRAIKKAWSLQCQRHRVWKLLNRMKMCTFFLFCLNIIFFHLVLPFGGYRR